LSYRLLPRLSWEKSTRAVGASAGFADALTVQAELTAADGRVCDTFLTAERLGLDSQVRSRPIAAASLRR